MANTTVTSTQFSLNASDIVKGLVMAIILPVLTIIMQSINAGSLIFDWKSIGISAIGGLVGYLIKNFFTPGAVVIKDPEVAESVKSGESIVKVVPK